MQIQRIVRTYIEHIRPHANDELKWFEQQTTLRDAIHFAAFATNSMGKRYSHQRRLSKATLKRAYQLLVTNEIEIKQCTNFDDLIYLLEELLGPINGIGELYIYDTALRIGAKLGLLPQKVYLHAGTRDGARALGFDGKTRVLEVLQLPEELHQLEAHEIEDVLCIFKDNFVKAQTPMLGREAIKRSWCN